MITRNVFRDRPSIRLQHHWRWRNRGDVHGHRLLEIEAIHSHNEDEVPDPSRADGHLLPNEITVTLDQGQDHRRTTIRLSREAAAQLATMLDEVLRWDGVAP